MGDNLTPQRAYREGFAAAASGGALVIPYVTHGWRSAWLSGYHAGLAKVTEDASLGMSETVQAVLRTSGIFADTDIAEGSLGEGTDI